tara:strand:- start:164 stop:301 length:138 start_codon:yes stop_codon:yes gene_type:complete
MSLKRRLGKKGKWDFCLKQQDNDQLHAKHCAVIAWQQFAHIKYIC